VVAVSDARDRVDWAQVLVAGGARLTARVAMRSSWSAESGVFSLLSGQYRLFVVGSTRHRQSSAVTGDHQL
jgi:hypothetical protein